MQCLNVCHTIPLFMKKIIFFFKSLQQTVSDSSVSLPGRNSEMCVNLNLLSSQ